MESPCSIRTKSSKQASIIFIKTSNGHVDVFVYMIKHHWNANIQVC
jgi:hypothetical protein